MTQTQDAKHQRINFAATFQTPLHARLTEIGKPVKVLATGDIEGMSPGYLIVDEDGTSRWVPISEVQIRDTSAQPVSDMTSGSTTTSSTRDLVGARR